tara:strand:- start:106 stop:417 length:312 start_codon:yes stop_codon:yes gene_type:complete
MKFKNLLFFIVLLNASLIKAENSLGSDDINKASTMQTQMLINRQLSLRLKLKELEIIKNNTQNPVSYKRAINDLNQLNKEIEIIDKMKIILANNSDNNQNSET